MSQVGKKDHELELKKHINAIHCTNNLTLLQRKLFNALLFNAYPNLLQQSQFEVPARRLCQLIGYNSNDYDKLKKALMALMTIVIEWNVIDYSTTTPQGKWRASSALASAKLESGICTYEYSSLMRELLYHPEIYGRLNMATLSKFKSSYGLALYENCIRYQSLPQTPWFTLDVFRKLMGVFDDKYPVFKDFKKRVLNIAMEEVNEHSSMILTPEIKRQNQQVTSIRFKLKSKSQTSLVVNSKHEHEDHLVGVLMNEFQLSPEVITDIFSKYEMHYISEKVQLILNSESYRLGKIRGIAGYLIEAIKKDYQVAKSSQEIVSAQRRKKNDKEVEQKRALADLEHLQDLYKNYVTAAIDDYVEKLADKDKLNLLQDFEELLTKEHSFVISWYRKEGLGHPAVRALFNSFIKNYDQKLAHALVSFDHFRVGHLQDKSDPEIIG